MTKKLRTWAQRFTRVHAKVGTGPMTLIWVDPDTALRLTDSAVLNTKIYFYELEWGRRCGGIVDKLEPIPFIERF